MSVVFLAIAAVLTAVAVLAVVPIMMRKPPNTGAGRKQSNILVARQRIEEVERQLKEGQLSDSDADAIRKEVEKELLTDVEDDFVLEDMQKSEVGRKKNRNGIIFVASFIPLASGALYLTLGEPGAITQQFSQATPVATSNGRSSQEQLSIEEITVQLENRVKQQPGDQRAWFALATSLVLQERYTEGAEAFAELRQLAGDSAELLVREADARGMAQGGVLTGEPETLIQLALQLDPENAMALWLAGLAASEQSRFTEALELWARAQVGIEDPEAREELMRLMQETQAQISPSIPVPEVQQTSVQVSVTLSPSVAEGIDPDTTVFVLARAVEGPPMPLAVVRHQVKDLPLDITLDDSMAMMPNLRLSEFDRVEVVARIAKSGQPRASSGDVFGQSEPVSPGSDTKVDIVIEEIVP